MKDDADVVTKYSEWIWLVFGIVQLTCLHTQCPNFPWGNRLFKWSLQWCFRLLYRGAPWLLISALNFFFLKNMMMTHFSLLLLAEDFQSTSKYDQMLLSVPVAILCKYRIFPVI